jgi:4-hydroxybenzoate polyprenyltransferase
MFKLLVLSLRPAQWTKNLIIFAGLVFSQNLFVFTLFLKSLLAFVLFCLISGSGYIINDTIDLKEDKRHPHKSRRPLASGHLKPSLAILTAGLISFFSLLISFLLNPLFGLVALSYLLLTVIYSLFLKNMVILDILAVSLGFVLRAIAGTVVIEVKMSSWLLVCTIFLALLLVLGKRRHQLLLLNIEQQPKFLQKYDPHLLNQLMAIVATSTILSYCFYTMAEETLTRFKTANLRFTIPFVLYGIFRYLYLIYRKNMGESPEEILLNDKPLMFGLILWVLSVMIVIYST